MWPLLLCPRLILFCHYYSLSLSLSLTPSRVSLACWPDGGRVTRFSPQARLFIKKQQQQQQQQSAIKQKQKQQQKQQHVRTLPLISNSLSSRISSQFLSSRPRYSQLYTHRPFSVFHFSLSFTYLSFSVPVFQIFHILLLLSITFS